MIKKLFGTALCLSIAACGWSFPALACTDFQVQDTDGSVIIGRSMEWGADLHSRLTVHPRDTQCVSLAPDGKPGLKWVSKFGYVGVDADDLDVALDGMNEKGLSFDLLWLPQYTKYQDVAPGQESIALSVLELGAWVLGKFETVDQVRSALGSVRVWAPQVASFGGVPTAHFQVHDASGKNLVVEFVDGKQKIYDNPLGIMTNAPTFDWHLTNLSNYLMVRADNPQQVIIGGTVLQPPGQGGGFLGIPGDWTPPSRFVRTAAMLRFAKKAENAQSGVNLAQHILNAVDIPMGAVRDKVAGIEHTDYTQWIVIKDLTNKNLYFKSYGDSALRKVDLSRLNFAHGQKVRYMPIDGGDMSADVTDGLK